MSQTNVEELLDRIVVALREVSIPKPPEVAGAARPSRADQSRSRGNREPVWRRSKKRIMAAAALVMLLMALATVPSLMPGTSRNTAFAEVQDAVSSFKSVRYRILDFHEDRDPFVTSAVVAREVGSRIEGPGALEQITNLKAERMLGIDHRTRTAKFYQLYLEGGEPPADGFIDRIRILAADAKAVSTQRLEGKKVLQFTFMNLGEYVVLVDPETKLPLRMELRAERGKGGGRPFREVITDFVFDAPLDNALFELTVPPGYTVQHCEEAPGRKPLAMKTLVISPSQGIGPVPLGASKKDVIAAFGKPDCVEIQGRHARTYSAPGGAAVGGEAETVLERLNYNSLGFELDVSSARGLTQFRCMSGSSIARRFIGKTDAGIALGASIDDVIQAYGAPEVRSHLRDEVLYYFHKGWSFVFAEGKLISFSASAPLSDLIEIEDNGDGSWTERPARNK